MSRLFVALELPEEIQDKLAFICHGLQGARWAQKSQMILSVRFIGEVDNSEEKDILSSLAVVQSSPFQLQLAGIGFFPPRKQPTQVWVGLDESDGLLTLRGRVEAALARVGVAREPRKFHPHVTIARLQGTPSEKSAQYLIANSLFRLEPFEVQEFSLFSSLKTSDGATYEKVASFPLYDSPARVVNR